MKTTLEQQLTDSLGRRADALGTDGPLRLDDVRSRATRIRRRRHATGALGAAAVLALVAPLGVMGVNGLDRSEPPVATFEPTPIAEPVVVSTDVEEGPAPHRTWLEDREVHLPDGTVLRTERRYGDVHLVAGKVLASWNDPDTGFDELDELGADGQVLASTPIGDDFVVAEDASVAAYLTRDAQLRLLDEDGTRDAGISLPGRSLVSLEGGDGCAAGCTVWWQEGGAGGLPGSHDLDTGTPTTLTGLLSLADVRHDGTVAAMTSVDELEPGSCSAVRRDGRQLWETCDHTLELFSPDGQWVSASDEYFSGAGQNLLAVLDAATGERLVEFQAGDGWFTQRVWEDETHLLAAHYAEEARTWQVFRVGLDGSVELAVPPRPGTMDDLGITLGG